MKRINHFINNNLNIIISIFILLQPILDLLVSLSINIFHISLNVGIIVRMFFLIFMLYVVFFVKQKRKTVIISFGLVFLYSIIFLMVQERDALFINLHGLLRVFYFPLLLMLFYSIKDDIKVDNLFLVITMFIYIILIFMAVVTGSGFNSYDIAKKGNLGWFNSTNEISCIISILIPYMFIIFKDKRHYIVKLLMSLIFIFVIGEVGTKTPILALGITVFATFLYCIINFVREKRYKSLITIGMIFIILVTAFILVVPRTNFYKNIKIHMNYLKLNNISEVFTNDYLFDHFIFSQRITFMKNTDREYSVASPIKKLFGIGYSCDSGKKYKAIEMDYYDIFYSHGVIGFIIYFGLYIYVLYRVFKNLPKRANFKYLMKCLSLILVLILSLYSGHVITAPAVSIYVVVIIIKLLVSQNKDLCR